MQRGVGLNILLPGSLGLSTSSGGRQSESEDKSSTDKKLSSSSSTRTARSTSKSWAAGILAEKKTPKLTTEGDKLKRGHPTVSSVGGGEGDKKIVKNPSNKRPIFRRRLEDMSWTTEKMDDKLIWVDCEVIRGEWKLVGFVLKRLNYFIDDRT